jgi:hypothetical protein
MLRCKCDLVEGPKVKVMSVSCEAHMSYKRIRSHLLVSGVKSLIGVRSYCAVDHMRYSLLHLSSAANGIHFLMGATLHLRTLTKIICVRSYISLI